MDRSGHAEALARLPGTAASEAAALGRRLKGPWERLAMPCPGTHPHARPDPLDHRGRPALPVHGLRELDRPPCRTADRGGASRTCLDMPRSEPVDRLRARSALLGARWFWRGPEALLTSLLVPPRAPMAVTGRQLLVAVALPCASAYLLTTFKAYGKTYDVSTAEFNGELWQLDKPMAPCGARAPPRRAFPLSGGFRLTPRPGQATRTRTHDAAGSASNRTRRTGRPFLTSL
jgi:hypothetical protein